MRILYLSAICIFTLGLGCGAQKLNDNIGGKNDDPTSITCGGGASATAKFFHDPAQPEL